MDNPQEQHTHARTIRMISRPDTASELSAPEAMIGRYSGGVHLSQALEAGREVYLRHSKEAPDSGACDIACQRAEHVTMTMLTLE